MKSLVAYNKIRDMILLGEKRPGTRLIIGDLEDELKIGRGPIREAIMRLDRSGLVKNVPYKGAVVANPPALKEISLIFEIRIDIEARLMSEAIGKFTEADISELEELHSQMKRMGKDFYSLDRQFHQCIYQVADMPHISAVVEKLRESVETFLTLYRHEDSDLKKFVSEHGAIIEAIKNKDEKAAREVMRANISGGLAVVKRTFSKLVLK